MKTMLDVKLTRLLKDHGYAFRGGMLVALAIRGFTSERTLGRFRDIFYAAEHLRSICDEDYRSAHDALIYPMTTYAFSHEERG